MKTTERGHQAEEAVAKKLKTDGHEIIALNWRTPRCEIDVISQSRGIIYLTEVKYRGSDHQGRGFDYITPKKMQQMVYAAEIWVQENNWTGDYRLQGAEVSGPSFENLIIVEI